jgi:hypothetical protein
MNITTDQRKRFWTVAALLATVYFAPSIATFVVQAVNPLPSNPLNTQQLRKPSPWQPTVAMAAQTGPRRGANDGPNPAQPGPRLAMSDVSGTWSYTMNVAPGVTASHRIDLIQKGDTITGRSRREIRSPVSADYVVFAITGNSLESGKSFTFQEGEVIERDPPYHPWCAIQSMTLAPTSPDTLTGTYEAPPCAPGPISLHRTK